MIDPQQWPAMIRTDHSNGFAHNTLQVRVPAIIREVQALNPDYPTVIQQALDQLRHDIENDAPIKILELPAPDYDDWLPAYQAHEGQSWLNAEWFYAETVFYRHMMQAVRWWETGRDPFASKKAAEVSGDGLWQTLDTALSVNRASQEDRLMAFLENTLWGNRIDLSYAVSAAHGSVRVTDDLLADDREAVVTHLLSNPGTVHLVADNAGTELAMDLVLIDALLDGAMNRVVLHLKMHPTFVSDATLPDVLSFLDILAARQHELATRLQVALVAGQLRLAPDLYWNSSRLLWDIPVRLAQTFDRASLVIIKGDANYRRLVGDAVWPTETPFAEVTGYFPVPVLAIRTLKSDPVVGLPAGLAAQLDSIDSQWRVNGKRGVIQAKL